jgi:putative ABC transport system substrate-binding protein
MDRRDFVTLLGGAVSLCISPIGVRGQEPAVRRIGVLLPLVEDDSYAKALVDAFVAALQRAGWIDGRNVRIEVRLAGPAPNDIRRNAAELVALRPEVMLAFGASNVGPLWQNSRTVPSVFPVIGGARC